MSLVLGCDSESKIASAIDENLCDPVHVQE